jgi:hypothetical protein
MASRSRPMSHAWSRLSLAPVEAARRWFLNVVGISVGRRPRWRWRIVNGLEEILRESTNAAARGLGVGPSLRAHSIRAARVPSRMASWTPSRNDDYVSDASVDGFCGTTRSDDSTSLSQLRLCKTDQNCLPRHHNAVRLPRMESPLLARRRERSKRALDAARSRT